VDEDEKRGARKGTGRGAAGAAGRESGRPPPQQQQREQREPQDFVGRYDQGAPWDGIPDREAAQRYQQAAPRLSPREYQESAQEASARLSPQERQRLGRYLQQRARQQGADVPGLNRDGVDALTAGTAGELEGRAALGDPAVRALALAAAGLSPRARAALAALADQLREIEAPTRRARRRREGPTEAPARRPCASG
jgi:hypothetical protein